LVAEDIREKALLLLHQEIPHGIAVEITKFDEKNDIVYIDADIVCEQDRHKGMIIGKGGSMLKQIGSLAREDAEKLLDKKVGLKLFVRVEKNWRDNPNKIRSLGY
jgi:GTP-binding protein Era